MNADAIIEMCKTHLDSSVCQMIQDMAIGKYMRENKLKLDFDCPCNKQYPEFRNVNMYAFSSMRINIDMLMPYVCDSVYHNLKMSGKKLVYAEYGQDDYGHKFIDRYYPDFIYPKVECPCRIIATISHNLAAMILTCERILPHCPYEIDYRRLIGIIDTVAINRRCLMRSLKRYFETGDDGYSFDDGYSSDD
jgi:hypothetical protein